MTIEQGGTECRALILAGGWSVRMRFPKAFLLHRTRSMALEIISRYRQAGVREIYMVLNHELFSAGWEEFLAPIREAATLIPNHYPEKGRGFSIHLGMNRVPGSAACFVHNVDNPPVGPVLLQNMLRALAENGYVVPVIGGKRGHPVLLSQALVSVLKRHDAASLDLREVLKGYSPVQVEAESKDILLNLNSSEEYFEYVRSIPA